MNDLNKNDVTAGGIPRHLIALALPMIASNLLELLQGFVNAIWLGHTMENAVGAAAVSFPVYVILISFAIGATTATNILIAQYFGAKDIKMVQKVINNSFSVSIIICFLLVTVGISCADFILKLMNTPGEIFALASAYLKISFAGFIFVYFSFWITSVLRGIGDTVTPLVFMGLGLLLNVILDPLLIMGIGPFPRLELNGAAYSSLISTAIAFIAGLMYLNRKNNYISFGLKKLEFDKDMIKLILKIAVPSTIEQTLISAGGAVTISLVNSFGVAAANAFGAASRIDSFSFMPILSLGTAVSIIAGQNIGAKKYERIKQIFKWGVIMGVGISTCVFLIAVCFPQQIFSIFGFGNDVEAMKIGVSYLRIVSISYIFLGVIFISNGIISGAGHTKVTMMFSVVSLWVLRIPISWVLMKTRLGINGIWLAIAISEGIIMMISLACYFHGLWKKEAVKIKSSQQMMAG